MLRGTEAPICRLDREARDVCCLLGAKVQDVAKRVPQLVKSTDHYPLLLFHTGTNDTASRNVGRIKEDFKALGVKAKSLMPKLHFPLFYKLEAGDQLQTGALWVSTLGFTAGGYMKVVVFMTVELSSMTMNC